MPAHIVKLVVSVATCLSCLGTVAALPSSSTISPAGAAPASSSVAYQEPVEATLIDAFRAPDPHQYGAGNRGWEYETAPGTPVRTSAPGEVLFAGRVASTLHVTVLHGDGLRTSYSYLEEIRVHVGQQLASGAILGTTGPRFHFGIRDVDGSYLDPALVLADGPPSRPRLVPGAGEGTDALREAERWALVDLVRATWNLTADGVEAAGAVAGDGLAVVSHYRDELDPLVRLSRIAAALDRWRSSQGSCTPAGFVSPAPKSRRVAVLVAGLGSTSSGASVDDVDVAALGYAQGDVLRFSYRGGRVPDPADGPSFSSLPTSDYGNTDSQGDLREAGEELARLLTAVADANPGVPVDVIAHSQGGLVTRLALLDHTGVPVELETVVTLGTPHGGADIATAAAAMRSFRPGGTTEVRVASIAGFDAGRPAIGQLAETSDLVESLRGAELVARSEGDREHPVRFVSVAARGDLVVAVPRTVVEGHPHVVVPLVGPSAHSDLPGSHHATREIALAVAGRPPTCASFTSALIDAVTGEAVSAATDAYGAARISSLAIGASLP